MFFSSKPGEQGLLVRVVDNRGDYSCSIFRSRKLASPDWGYRSFAMFRRLRADRRVVVLSTHRLHLAFTAGHQCPELNIGYPQLRHRGGVVSSFRSVLLDRGPPVPIATESVRSTNLSISFFRRKSLALRKEASIGTAVRLARSWQSVLHCRGNLFCIVVAICFALSWPSPLCAQTNFLCPPEGVPSSGHWSTHQ